MKHLYFTFAALLLVVLTSCGDDGGQADGEGNDLTPVSFVLDWTPNTNHTGIYVAKEKGYFAEQGLDVEIMLPGEAGANQLIASGEADFGVSYQERITQARAEGLPLVSIAAILQHNTAGYMSPVEKDITEPADFEGRIYGGLGTPLEEATMETIMNQESANIDQVDFINIGDADFFTAVQRDVDFSTVYYGWTGIEAELREEEMNMVYLRDFADELDLYTPILATSEAMIETDTETVEAFVYAVTQGYEDAIEQPEEAAEILIEQESDLDPDLVYSSQEWVSPRYQDDAENWGVQEASRWEDYADWMFENGIIDEEVEADDAFTNDFLPHEAE